ncbi:MAG TPA: KH domain-containing protein [Nitrososphaeraceae archaeon]|nr:KH domain-containing protein [Nitrososphaeraceae archaeon]
MPILDKDEQFRLILHIPEERIPVIIGNKGKTKIKICKMCNVEIAVESKTGQITIDSTTKNFDENGALKARDIINAISNGFSPERAFRILDDESLFQVLDLRNFTTSSNSTNRIKGRIIGEKGKARKNIEELTNTFISIYGHTVSLIGNYEETKLALDAIMLLVNGRSHKTAYEMLYQAKRKSKIEKLQLWEK